MLGWINKQHYFSVKASNKSMLGTQFASRIASKLNVFSIIIYNILNFVKKKKERNSNGEQARV